MKPFSESPDNSKACLVMIQSVLVFAHIRPDLSIEYSNFGAEGDLGVGFKISATSIISRCAKTIAQDGKIEGVK